MFAAKLGVLWWRLYRRARRLPRPDAVVVGYMGHFDVHLARKLWPDVPIVLDHLASVEHTAVDRAIAGRWLVAFLRRLDRWAVRKATIPVVDTRENVLLLPEQVRDSAMVVAVGSATEWFHNPSPGPECPLRVVFFGLFTPLQGTAYIGEALGLLTNADVDVTMIGRGQDYEACRSRSAANDRIVWIDWMEQAELQQLVGGQDVCLGIFGTGEKASCVVPNKVFQGAAAGCVVVTSDTPPQRRVLGDVGVFIEPGDPSVLASTIRHLAADRDALIKRRSATYEHAVASFGPKTVVAELFARLDLLA